MKTSARYFPLLLFLVIPILMYWPTMPHVSVKAVGPELVSGAETPDWGTVITITNDVNIDASFPIVRAAPNNSRVMIIYKGNDANPDTDLYYTVSSNNGENWSNPIAINPNNQESQQASFDFDASSKAHLVWREGDSIAYARETSPGSWGATDLLIPTLINTLASTNPFIINSEANTVDIVWSDGVSALVPDPSIYYMRSQDGGDTWTTPDAVSFEFSGFLSQFPVMAIARDGTLHVVWQEQYDIASIDKFKIHYSQGTPSGATVSWSAPIIISTVSDAWTPDITIAVNGNVHVIYNDYVDKDTQYIRHTQCSAQCTNANNWQSSGRISGEKFSAQEPLKILATLDQQGVCTKVYFHGSHPDWNPANEAIWGLTSCDSWTTRELMTSQSVRSTNPSLEIQHNWWTYLAYQQDDQIYLHRTKPDVFFSIIEKN